jgi:hypothetical protein
MIDASGLDVFHQVGSTATMNFYVTPVMCQHVDNLDVRKHIINMARQRCVGASDNCTGY